MAGYLYDIGTVIILLICILAGYRKGVLRTALNMVCFVIAFAAASFFSSETVTVPVYEKYFKERLDIIIENSISEAKKRAEGEVSGYVQGIADDIIDSAFGGNETVKEFAHLYIPQGGEFLRGEFAGLIESGKIDLRTLLTNPLISGKIEDMAEKYSLYAAEEINSRLPLGITVDKEDILGIMTDNNAWEALIYEALGVSSDIRGDRGLDRYIESTVVRPVFLRFLGVVMWAAVFSVVNFVLHIIVSVVLVIRKIEPVKICDSAAGAVLGAAFGAAAVIACCVVITLLVRFTGGMTYMNEDIFSDTVIFGKIYDHISQISF